MSGGFRERSLPSRPVPVHRADAPDPLHRELPRDKPAERLGGVRRPLLGHHGDADRRRRPPALRLDSRRVRPGSSAAAAQARPGLVADDDLGHVPRAVQRRHVVWPRARDCGAWCLASAALVHSRRPHLPALALAQFGPAFRIGTTTPATLSTVSRRKRGRRSRHCAVVPSARTPPPPPTADRVSLDEDFRPHPSKLAADGPEHVLLARAAPGRRHGA